LKQFVVVENKRTGMDGIKLTSEPYSGIIYTYGKVEFIPDEENFKLKLKFDYEILDYANKQFDLAIFEQYIGDILTDLIHEGIAENSISYTGGVDENRTEDSEQSSK
jgi:DNA gyrase/topoisomerase IV subunit B